MVVDKLFFILIEGESYMEFNNFSLSSTKIKSSWFDGKSKSVFNHIGKEEGLNLYLQLFRFRLHQITGDGKQNYNQHVFRITIGELTKFTKINLTKKLTYKKIVDLLKKMEKVGIIKLYTPSRWDQLLDDKDKIKSDKLIVLQATDIPNIHVERNKNGRDIDIPDTDNDYYISINFKIIDYMYKDISLTSKDVSIYLLLLKLSNGGENKATININTMKDWLNYSNDTIINILITLNQNYMVSTYVKKKKKKISYEHVPVRSYNHIDIFKTEKEDDIRKFLNRYKKSKRVSNSVKEEKNPFLEVDNNQKKNEDNVKRIDLT